MYSRALKIVVVVLLFGVIPFAYCAKWIIMLENSMDIEREYFYIRNAVRTVSAPDKFRDKTPAELGKVCNRLKNSKIYHRLSLPYPSPIPQPSRVDEIPERNENEPYRLEDILYAYRSLKTTAPEVMKELRVLVFPCQTHESIIFWLTYGYSDDVLFLLEEVDGGQAVSFVGQSLPVPDIDDTFSPGDILDEYYFSKATPKFAPSVPEVLYPFVSSLQFRLCCLAHAAREDAHQEGRESFTINYANSDPNAESNRNYFVESHGPSAWAEISVWALGCAINPKEADDFEFYLRHSVINPSAVFALDHVGVRGTKKVLQVKQLLVNTKVSVASAFHKLGMVTAMKIDRPIFF